MSRSFNSASLLLAYHGSSEDDRPAKTGEHLAERMRGKNLFLEVCTGFYKHPPYLHESLQKAKGDPVIIVPMLMSDGYFAEHSFPKAMEFPEPAMASFPHEMKFKDRRIVYCEPIGLHPNMTQLVLEGARETLNSHPFPSRTSLSNCSLALIGHGTPKNHKSKRSILEMVKKIQNQPGICLEARAFFIEEPPFIQEILDWKTKSEKVVVVPGLIADGPHTTQDIPLALGQSRKENASRLQRGSSTWRNPTERSGKSIWVCPPVGSSPSLPDMIVDYVKNHRLLMD